MPKTNLRWEVKKLQRAGHSSSRITKQVQHRLKRAHAGKLHPGRSGDKIQSLAEEAVRKQRYHLTKQLHQAMKKAKSFLLRKLMRRGKEGGKAEGGGKADGGAEAEERLRVLRALPVQEVARTALSSLGFEDDGGHAHKDDQAALQEWRPLLARLPALCERTERQLLASAAVVLPMATLTLARTPTSTLAVALAQTLAMALALALVLALAFARCSRWRSCASISPLYLACISPASPLCLPYISPGAPDGEAARARAAARGRASPGRPGPNRGGGRRASPS